MKSAVVYSCSENCEVSNATLEFSRVSEGGESYYRFVAVDDSGNGAVVRLNTKAKAVAFLRSMLALAEEPT